MVRKFTKFELELMNFKLDRTFRDSQLSLIERVRLYFNKEISGAGNSSGNGYSCINCGNANIKYFKRYYKVIDAEWDAAKIKGHEFPNIKSKSLSNEIFYLMGKCNNCSNEQRVSNRPNRVSYYYYLGLNEPFTFRSNLPLDDFFTRVE